jgi:hypothetical protein
METVPVTAGARRLFLYRERAEAFYGECLRALLVGGRTGLLLLVIVCSACSVNPYSDEPDGREPASGASGEDARDPDSSRDSATGSGRGPGSATAHEREVLTRVAQAAQGQVGVPYRFGGHTPKGFDCSGLVFYSYALAGVTVPRTSDAQLRASRELELAEAVPGDLVFFSSPDKVSHVGIYLGDGQFIHAPSTGKRVVVNKLDQPYYQRHLVGVGRLGIEQLDDAPAATPLR